VPRPEPVGQLEVSPPRGTHADRRNPATRVSALEQPGTRRRGRESGGDGGDGHGVQGADGGAGRGDALPGRLLLLQRLPRPRLALRAIQARKRKGEEPRLRGKDGKLVSDITNQKDLQEISPFDDEWSFVVDFRTVPLM
uniref:Uncharacterized protein n=1 Tax=Triticum urartu TaxID=4572 RepID=A0A8R7UKU3_TRIUA